MPAIDVFRLNHSMAFLPDRARLTLRPPTPPARPRYHQFPKAAWSRSAAALIKGAHYPAPAGFDFTHTLHGAESGE
jgi:hypothetical protein